MIQTSLCLGHKYVPNISYTNVTFFLGPDTSMLFFSSNIDEDAPIQFICHPINK